MSTLAPSDLLPTVAPTKRGSRLPGYLLVAAVLGAWLLWPQAWVAWNNREPQVLSLEDYLTHGSTRQWLVLKDCYVPQSSEIATNYIKDGQNQGRQYSYFALTAGPDDKRTAKIFVRPQSWSAGEDQLWLGREGEPPVDLATRAMAKVKPVLQEVSGIVAVGFEYSSDVKNILRKHGDADPILFLHNGRPPAMPAAIAAFTVPLVLAGSAALLFMRRRRMQ